MSVAVIGVTASVAAVGAVATVGASIYSSNQASEASEAANQTAANDYAAQQARWDAGRNFLGTQGVRGEADIRQGLAYAQQGMSIANRQNAAYQGQSSMYGDMARDNEAQMTAQFEDFLGGFQEMLGDNEQAMVDFTRRYGPLMDNVEEGIKNVSQAKLSAQGREQLSIDTQNLSKSFNQAMASKNMGRSGISVEGERRMAMDTATQARAIDVNSNAQAMQLQGQGIQNLNSMQQGINNLQNQRLGIQQNQAGAQQAVGQAYGNMAQNMYGASQNMFGQGFAGVTNANNNIANMLGTIGSNRINQQNSFYSGQQAPNAGNLIQTQQNQAAGYNADAGGYMQAAGSIIGSNTMQNAMSSFGGTNPDNGWLY